MGGLGLNHVAKAVLFEEAGYSPLGPTRSTSTRPTKATST
jgi:acyl-CoA dehydrogenase